MAGSVWARKSRASKRRHGSIDETTRVSLNGGSFGSFGVTYRRDDCGHTRNIQSVIDWGECVAGRGAYLDGPLPQAQNDVARPRGLRTQ